MKIIYFKAEWCAPCRTTLPIVEKVSTMVEDVNVDIINVDENQELTKEYGVRSIPAMFFLDDDGNRLGNHIGGITESNLLKKINELK